MENKLPQAIHYLLKINSLNDETKRNLKSLIKKFIDSTNYLLNNEDKKKDIVSSLRK